MPVIRTAHRPRPADPSRFVFHGIDWTNYTRLLRAFDQQRLRTTYDDGTFEIMSPSTEHELYKGILCRMVEICAEETGADLVHAGSATLRLKPKKRGLEPDECFWIASSDAVAGRVQFDLSNAPPPDLAVEVDITSHVLDRLDVYASLGVREIWRQTRTEFGFLGLEVSGKYVPVTTSPAFPWLSSQLVQNRIAHYAGQRKLEFLALWREDIRKVLAKSGKQKRS